MKLFLRSACFVLGAGLCQLLVMFFLVGCSDDSSSGTSTVTPTFKSGSSRRAGLPSFSDVGLSAFGVDMGKLFFRAAGDVGHNTAAGLTSFQYYVTRVDLCNDMTISGTSYSNATGCVTVYGQSNADNAYDTFKITDASADTSGNWIDVVAGKAVSAASITAGTYNYGLIETRKPVKVNATLTVPNGSHVLKTCTGGTVTSSGSAEDLLETVTVSDMTSCTKALTTLGSNGGGQWFKFQSAVTLTAGTSYVLDLVSNPVSLIAGGVEAIGGWGTEASYKDGTYVMLVPPISLVPIIRSSSQATIREQYELDSMSGINGKIVLDLYYVGTTADVGSGTILGAGARFVNNSSATTLTKMWNPYSVTTNSDGTITVNDYQDRAIVSSLTRSTTTTTGGTQSVTVRREVLSSGQTGTGSLSATATFMGVAEQ